MSMVDVPVFSLLLVWLDISSFDFFSFVAKWSGAFHQMFRRGGQLKTCRGPPAVLAEDTSLRCVVTTLGLALSYHGADSGLKLQHQTA